MKTPTWERLAPCCVSRTDRPVTPVTPSSEGSGVPSETSLSVDKSSPSGRYISFLSCHSASQELKCFSIIARLCLNLGYYI